MENEQDKVAKYRHFLTLKEVAERLAITEVAARLLVVADKAMPYLKVGRKSYRVREIDLDKYIEKINEIK